MPQNQLKSRTNSYLYRHEAEMRSQIISDVTYYIDLVFDQEDSNYSGCVKVNFHVCNTSSHRLFLEFAGAVIQELTFDSEQLQDDEIVDIWHNHRIMLPQQWSEESGYHTIKARFQNTFDNTGFGLFAFREKGQTYIYSQFCSNYAHTVFPCFDQPDIKGLFSLNVTCPLEWQVISNQNPETVVQIEDQAKWIFEYTPPISTYLFCINAGDWFKYEAHSKYNKMQTNYYCRQSCSPRLGINLPQIQNLIDFALEFYEKHFGVPFPFSKYDQLFCPELSFSGMENPGAVDLTENYLFYDNSSTSRMTQRALTVVHELSHMWFGDLVTMKWWKDIWLNEAFAVLISYFCIHEMMQTYPMPFDNVWCKFLTYKENGYEQDIQTYTHSIEVPVDEASESQENFDSITYSKGAAVLHQLVSIIGWKDFYTSLNVYFQKYKWKNADMTDLFAIVGQQVQSNLNHKYYSLITIRFNMERWVHEWISTPSLNQLQGSIEPNLCIKIIQQPHSKQIHTIRQHNFLMTVYFQTEDGVVSITENVFIDREETLIRLEESNTIKQLLLTQKIVPSAVMLNENDQGYFFNLVDDSSRLFLLHNFKTCFSNDLQKINFLKALQHSCIKGYLPSKQLFELCISLILNDQPKEIFMYILQTINFMADYITLEQRNEYFNQIFDVLYSYLASHQHESADLLGMIKEYIGGYAMTPAQAKLLYQWLVYQNADFQRSFTAGSYVLTAFLIKFFKTPFIFDQTDHHTYSEYWLIYVNNSKYYKRIKDGCSLSLEDVEAEFEKWVSPNGLTSCSLYELEFFMQGINNEQALHYKYFISLYYRYLERFLQTQNKQFIKRIFKKLHPKFGELVTPKEILTSLITKYMDSDDTDKMFYVKQLQEKVDFINIKLQIQQGITSQQLQNEV